MREFSAKVPRPKSGKRPTTRIVVLGNAGAGLLRRRPEREPLDVADEVEGMRAGSEEDYAPEFSAERNTEQQQPAFEEGNYTEEQRVSEVHDRREVARDESSKGKKKQKSKKSSNPPERNVQIDELRNRVKEMSVESLDETSLNADRETMLMV
jgi:hypothetical protein